MKILTCSLISLLIIFQISYAQNNTGFDSHKSRPGLIINLNNDALSFVKTTSDFFLSPLQFDKQDLLLTTVIMSATAFSVNLDNPVRNSVRSLRSSSLDNITLVGEAMGNARYTIPLCGALFIGGYLIGDNELRKTGLMLTEAVFLNGLVTGGLKAIAGRSRPFKNEGNFDMDFFEFEFEKDENSLPSGHTSTAFTIATILSHRINNTYATIGLYSLAGLTAFQRIYDDKHWFSDTVLGAALGTVIGLKVIKLNSGIDNETADPDFNMNITPMIYNGSYGITLNMNF